MGHLRISCLNTGQGDQMDPPTLADMRTIFDSDSDSEEPTNVCFGEMLDNWDGHQQELHVRGEKRTLSEYKETHSYKEEFLVKESILMMIND